MTRKILGAKLLSNGTSFEAVITTDSVDRDGEVLIPAGMDATEFAKNPIVFWNHDHGMPIGKADSSFVRTKRYIKARVTFAKRPDDWTGGTFFPDFARTVVEQGIVKGVSVGFLPIENGTRQATKRDLEQFGPGVRRVYSHWKLVEFSLAPLPANQDALIEAVNTGKAARELVYKCFGLRIAEPGTRRVVMLLD